MVLTMVEENNSHSMGLGLGSSLSDVVQVRVSPLVMLLCQIPYLLVTEDKFNMQANNTVVNNIYTNVIPGF